MNAKLKKVLVVGIISFVFLSASFAGGGYTFYRIGQDADRKRDNEYQSTIDKANEDIKRLESLTREQTETIGQLEGRIRSEQEADARRYREFAESIRLELESVGELDGTIEAIGNSLQRIEQEISK